MGSYLTEPKPNVVFDPPARGGTHGEFARLARKRGVRLALPSRMLVSGGRVFINGESHRVELPTRELLAKLADERELRLPLTLHAQAGRVLYEWYRAGYIELGAGRASR
jgi:50S ribosomal protein L16 3-hydroxylase